MCLMVHSESVYSREYNTVYARTWRHEARRCLIEALGGACIACGYAVCAAALDFHHVVQEDKDGEIGKLLAHRAWRKVVREAQKCVLLCCRCHREVHAGERELPSYKLGYDIPGTLDLDLPTRILKGTPRKVCPVSSTALRKLRTTNSFDKLAVILGANKRTVMRWCLDL